MEANREYACPPAKPRQFLPNSGVEPSYPNFLSGTPTFTTHIVYAVVLCQYCALHWPKSHFSLCQKSSVTQKYVKNAFPVGAYTPGPAGGSSRRSPRLLCGCAGETPSLLSGKLSVGPIKILLVSYHTSRA